MKGQISRGWRGGGEKTQHNWAKVWPGGGGGNLRVPHTPPMEKCSNLKENLLRTNVVVFDSMCAQCHLLHPILR